MSQKLEETICWMKSIFMITQYFPLKSIITSLSHWTFSSCQIFKGIYSNPKKESENLTTPLASVFQMAFFDKTLLSSAFPQKHLWCSEDEGISEQRIHTSDCQLFTVLTALNSEHGLTYSHPHMSLSSALGAIQTKATSPAVGPANTVLCCKVINKHLLTVGRHYGETTACRSGQPSQ